MRKGIVILVVLLVASGYVLQLAFHLMNLPRDDAYIGGIFLAIAWLVVLLSVGKYGINKIVTSYKEQEQRRKETNEKQSSAVSTPVEPTANNRMHNTNRPRNGGN